MPLTCSGTCFIRSSASGVHRTVSSARTSRRGTSSRVERRTSQGAARRMFSALLPSAVSSFGLWTPIAAQHDEPRTRLARVIDDLLERLAVEERFLDLDARLARHPLAHFEVRLVDLREPGVDDFLVELVLLLEAENLRRLLGEDVDDAVEDGVVQVGVVDGDRLDLLAERRGPGRRRSSARRTTEDCRRRRPGSCPAPPRPARERA